ncbi:MAG: RNA methyltransferase [Spirochaetaceae bacterium]|nr:RNA methyltransferase [Spirochaetaceae bacterium]
MFLSKIRIVLCRPEESRNIGSVCRAMANCGMDCLRIVGRREDYDDEKVRVLAIHAASIWENAEFYDSITEATADCVIAAGTTRRPGKKRKSKLLLPEELAELVSQNQPAAIIFGNERTGLTDEELDECTLGVTIPSDSNFASLNLSHAVQIICYTIFRNATDRSPGYIPVPLERLDKTVDCIGDSLKKIGFFSVTGRPDMERFWRSILSRASLSEGECQYLEKIFDKAAGLASKSQNEM